ncbi:ATP-binding protein [Roseitranquillus sediminis]|uniref:ATP-binding protein n=1 Tax=Roseitranquillus sediminis TaxID=2809051 RepID=UPI001D0BFA29|nr:ATP-binding protein [Roseitranquillus sediminis]MBM9594728.1 response regulator [Roseitranquillus sediminis]
MRDLPSRFLSISIAAILATWYLPLQITVGFFVPYLILELLGWFYMRRCDKRIDHRWMAGLLILAWSGASLFSMFMVQIWNVDGVAPKVVAFSGIATALIHCVMVRSTWMLFGLASAIPLIAGLLYAVVREILLTGTVMDALAGGALLTVMVAYLLRSMIDMHQTRVELLQTSERAQAASKAKSRFLAAISHEIRTPLNAIYGMAQALREDPEPERIEERSTLLLKASMSLKAIVDDVLDHAKIEAGRFRLACVPTRVGPEVSEVVEMFHMPAAEKGLALSLRTEGHIPPLVSCDPLRIRQVLSNLISNAVKFSERGRIDVIVRAEPDGEAVVFSIDVADEGPGLTDQDMEQLFRDFARIEREDRPTSAGTGLGLSIARGFARMMGGDITVASQPGQGSIFTFKFRAAIVEPSPLADASGGKSASLVGVRSILLVDDTASNRYVVRALLRQYHVELVEAENGQEALEALRQRDFSLVLLDMHMPVLDGPQTIAEMKQAGGRISQTPVIALTADAAPEDRERYLAHGISGYLAKPIRRADLLAEIARVVPPSSAEAA